MRERERLLNKQNQQSSWRLLLPNLLHLPFVIFLPQNCALVFFLFFHAKLLSSDSLPNMGDLFIVSSVVNYRIVYAYILRCSPKMMMGR